MPITAAVFSWNRSLGTPLAVLLDSVPMDLRVGARQAGAVWARICVQDSRHCIDRSDVSTPSGPIGGPIADVKGEKADVQSETALI